MNNTFSWRPSCVRRYGIACAVSTVRSSHRVCVVQPSASLGNTLNCQCPNGIRRRICTWPWHPFGTMPCRFTQVLGDLAQLRLSPSVSCSACSGRRSPSSSFSSAVLSPVSGPHRHWILTLYFVGTSLRRYRKFRRLSAKGTVLGT